MRSLVRHASDDDCRGDRHDPLIVEYFLDQNILGYFVAILADAKNRSGDVAIQILQTLSILIQNVKNKETIYCLFSNNHINRVVDTAFDFGDDEVLGLYVNLLKTISLKLDENTVQFFLIHAGKSSTCRFPLYSEALKFGGMNDGMVRAAVRNITLNAFCIPSVTLRNYFGGEETRVFFEGISKDLKAKCLMLDRLLSSTGSDPNHIEKLLSYIDDEFTYFSDIWSTNIPMLKSIALRYFWKDILLDVIINALKVKCDTCSIPTALHVLEIFFTSTSNSSLLSLLVSILLGGDFLSISHDVLVSLKGESLLGPLTIDDLIPSGSKEGTLDLRASLLSHLKSENDVHAVTGVVRLVANILCNKSVPASVLSTVGLSPFGVIGEPRTSSELSRPSSSQRQTEFEEDVESHPMRHADIFESVSSVCFSERHGEIIQKLFRVSKIPSLSPITMMLVIWILKRLTSEDPEERRAMLEVQCNSSILDSMIESHHRPQIAMLVEKSDWVDGVPLFMTHFWSKQCQMISKTVLFSTRASVVSWEFSSFLNKYTASEKSIPVDMKSNLKCLLLSIMNFIASCQLQQLLQKGSIDPKPPFSGPTVVSWTKLAESEVQVNRAMVDPTGTFPCTKINTGAAHQHVLIKLETSANAHLAWYDQNINVLLLDDNSNTLTGPLVVTGVAPVASIHPEIDKTSNPMWMHMTVRPPLSAILKSISASPLGIDFFNLESCIKVDEWTLSFTSSEDAALIHQLISHVIVDLKERASVYVASAVAQGH